MKKRGRPKLPKHKTKRVFSLRVSTEELREMEASAKRAGKKVREWARICLLDK